MKKQITIILALGLLAGGYQTPVRAADGDEQQQIGILQSGASLTDKDAACAKLKRMGTAQSVPALGALLEDEKLSHSARFALESMPLPEAGSALAQALGKTSGLTRIGIINSLGFRAESQAEPLLENLLQENDPQTASAAAAALGKIGNPEAIKALQGALKAQNAPVHSAVVDGLLACGQRLVKAGNATASLPIFQQLFDSESQDGVRVAAYRGILLASGDRQLDLMAAAIAGDDGPSQVAALQLVHDVRSADATAKLAAILPKASSIAQIALISGLSQRNDSAAISAIAAQVANSDLAVRLAAIQALGDLADASAIPVLAKAAASGSEPEQAAAQDALAQLRTGKPTEALLAHLASAQPAEQAEIARALGQRADAAALPKLLELAQNGSESVRPAVFQALSLLAGSDQLDRMTRLVADAKTAETRSQAAEALSAVYQRVVVTQGKANAALVVKAMDAGAVETRIELLRVCSALIDPEIRRVFHAAVTAPEPALRTAAVRAMAQSRDAGLLSELQKIACDAPEKNFRVLATRGCARLVASPEGAALPAAARVAALNAILKTAPAATEKRVLLSGFAEIGDVQALDVVLPMVDNPEVQSEAARAVINIATAIAGAHPKEATDACKKVLSTVADSTLKQDAQTVLAQLKSMEGFITNWQVAGPYRQQGKEYSALFDIAFPPESADAHGVSWQSLALASDPKRPWLMDFLKTLGGEQAVAYARVWIHSETAQPARLEIGSDDGAKIWLNGKIVHANNTARPIKAGEDKADVSLNAGWNPLLIKVTQNNQGWEFAVRCVKPDGNLIEGLELSAVPPADK